MAIDCYLANGYYRPQDTIRIGVRAMFETEILGAVVACASVVAMDVVLSGDNAIVVGLAVSGLDADRRVRAMAWGIGVAVALRVVFALAATELLQVRGAALVGGALLLWVCWKLWRELRLPEASNEADGGAPAAKTLRSAVWQIVVADVSMSLDNVLAVAGAARDHQVIMVVGLLASVIMMGVAASLIARLLNRHAWVAYVGLSLILCVAVRMLADGGIEAAEAMSAIF
jgi:YjbE family integral membrane protein